MVPLPLGLSMVLTAMLGSLESTDQPGTWPSERCAKSGFSTMLPVSAHAAAIWSWVAGVPRVRKRESKSLGMKGVGVADGGETVDEDSADAEVEAKSNAIARTVWIWIEVCTIVTTSVVVATETLSWVTVIAAVGHVSDVLLLSEMVGVEEGTVELPVGYGGVLVMFRELLGVTDGTLVILRDALGVLEGTLVKLKEMLGVADGTLVMFVNGGGVGIVELSDTLMLPTEATVMGGAVVLPPKGGMIGVSPAGGLDVMLTEGPGILEKGPGVLVVAGPVELAETEGINDEAPDEVRLVELLDTGGMLDETTDEFSEVETIP